MPELGKATYILQIDSRQFHSGIDKAEARATQATNKIAAGMGKAEVATSSYGKGAQVASAQAGAAATRLSGTVAAATASASASYGKTAQAASSSAAAQVASAEVVQGAWKRVGITMAALGAKSARHFGFGALAAGYLVIKSGVDDIRESDLAMKQVEAGLESTGRVAAVTSEHVEKLGKKWQEVAGVEDEVTMASAAVLLSFTNIRNGVGKSNQVFDRAVEAAQNLTARFGGGLQSAIVLVGKALNDPAKGLTALQKRGIQFTSSQREMIKALLASGQGLKAQQIILGELDRQVGGSAEKVGTTFAGALARAKANLGDNAGLIISSLIPAFGAFIGILGTVVKLTSEHTTVLKVILGVYITYKVVTMAAFFALKLHTVWTGIATIKNWIFISSQAAKTTAIVADTAATGANTAATMANTAATTASATGFTRLGKILGKGGLYTAAIGAGFAIGTIGIKLLGLEGPLGKVGGWVHALGEKFGILEGGISRASEAAAASMSDPKIQQALADAYKKYEAMGLEGAPKQIRDAAIAKTVGEGYNWNDAKTFAGRNAAMPGTAASGGAADPGIDMLPAGLGKKAAADAKKAADKAKAAAEAASALRARNEASLWDISQTQADRAGEAALARWYARRRAYLVRMLDTKKGMDLQLRAQYEQEITQIDKTVADNAKQAAEDAAAKAAADADAAWSIRSTIAERGGPKMQLAYLRSRRAYLKREIEAHRTDLQLVAQNEQEITSIDAEIIAMQKEEADKRLVMTARQRIQLTKAERTEGGADDLRFWNARMKQLREELAMTKKNSERAADIEEEITAVFEKVKDAKEKQKNKRLNSLKEIQSVMDLRGTWFGQFASSVFHTDVTGRGLAMGSSGNTAASGARGMIGTDSNAPERAISGGGANSRTMNYTQNNEYNEIPRDKFAQSRQMRQAASGAWD